MTCADSAGSLHERIHVGVFDVHHHVLGAGDGLQVLKVVLGPDVLAIEVHIQ